MTIGQIVRHHRKKAGLTQFELASEVGLTKNVVSNIERDVDTVGVNAYQKVADYFTIPLILPVMPGQDK